MLDLNSSRWSELRHAYGTAEDVPDLLRALAAETEPRYSDDLARTRGNPTPWEQVYLDSPIVCPHCGLSFEIREGLSDGSS